MTNSDTTTAKTVGMQCTFDGTLISQPSIKAIKDGLSHVLTATVVYENYDQSTNICRLSVFQGTNGNLTLQRGDRVHISGTLMQKTWEKDGVTKTGLNVSARSCDVRKIEFCA